MGRASLDKGRKFKQLIAGFWRDAGYEVYLRSIGEPGDDMRIEEMPLLSFELKGETARRNLSGWMHQAIENAHGRIPVLIFKRVGIGAAAKQWCVLEMGQFERMLQIAALAAAGNPELWREPAGGLRLVRGGLDDVGPGREGLDDGGRGLGSGDGGGDDDFRAGLTDALDGGPGPHVAADHDAADDEQ